MPELPEVETVKRSLSLKLIGKTIYNVRIYYDNMFRVDTVHPSLHLF